MLTVTKSNTANVVDLTYIKAWLRISGTAEDAILTDLIKAAQDRIEVITGRCLTASTIVATWQPFTGNELLPYAPFTAVTSIESDGEDVSESYAINNEVITGIETELDLTVTYTGGYATDLPFGLKIGLVKLISHMYYNRGDSGEIPKDILQEIQPYSRNLML